MSIKLQGKLSAYLACNPRAMATEQSTAAIEFAFVDMRADILALAKLLCVAAYPRRGTAEEQLTMQQFAAMVQAVIPHEDAVAIEE